MIVPRPRLLAVVALVALPLATAAALSPAWEPVAWLGALLLVALAALDAVRGRRAAHTLALSLPPLVRGTEARATNVAVRIHHGGQPYRLRVGLAWPDGLAAPDDGQWVMLPPDAPAAEILFAFTPQRRGRFTLTGGHWERPSPWGLWDLRGFSASPCEVRAYPNLRDELRSLLALRRGQLGAHRQRVRGAGREFESLRDYLPGDAYDSIHWKATARRAAPVTKVYQVERQQELYVVLDASRLSARPVAGQPTLERFLRAALVLGSVAQEHGDRFGVVAFRDTVRRFVRAGSGPGHAAACREALFALEAAPVSPDFDELATFLRLRLRRRALLLVLTELDDPVLAESFERALAPVARQHLIVAAMLQPEDARPLFEREDDVTEVDDVYRRLGGHVRWHALRERESSLRRAGIRMALLDPKAPAAHLASLYADLKARQLV